MALFLITFCVMALAVAGMAVGVLFGLRPIAGSCGGLNAVNGSGACQACSRPCRQRRQNMAKHDGTGSDGTSAHNTHVINRRES